MTLAMSAPVRPWVMLANSETKASVERQLHGIFGSIISICHFFWPKKIRPYGHFIPAVACEALGEWLYTCEKQCENWKEIEDLADKQLIGYADARDVSSVRSHLRTWVIRKADALYSADSHQEAKEYLFSHLDLVKDDPLAQKILE
jgi:hypothetical protein